MLNTDTNERYTIEPLNEVRFQHAAVVYDGEIVVMGGLGNGQLASVEAYSFRTKTWRHFPPMTTSRNGHCACVHNGRIYVIGGEDTNSVEFYDPETLSWKLHHDIDVPRVFSSVVQM